MNILRLSLLASLVIILTGCVRMRYIPYDTAGIEPKPEGYTIELLDASSINRPFKAIGVVQANAGKLHNSSHTIKKMKEVARRKGGDAIIDLQHGSGSGRIITPIGSTSHGTIYASGSPRETWSATVIAYLPEDKTKSRDISLMGAEIVSDTLDQVIKLRSTSETRIQIDLFDVVMIGNTSSSKDETADLAKLLTTAYEKALLDSIQAAGLSNKIHLINSSPAAIGSNDKAITRRPDVMIKATFFVEHNKMSATIKFIDGNDDRTLSIISKDILL